MSIAKAAITKAAPGFLPGAAFVDGPEYDKGEEAVFALVRAAFTADRRAAGGDYDPCIYR